MAVEFADEALSDVQYSEGDLVAQVVRIGAASLIDVQSDANLTTK